MTAMVFSSYLTRLQRRTRPRNPDYLLGGLLRCACSTNCVDSWLDRCGGKGPASANTCRYDTCHHFGDRNSEEVCVPAGIKCNLIASSCVHATCLQSQGPLPPRQVTSSLCST